MFRSAGWVTLPDGRTRSASTAILYLLPAGAWSAWHRVRADEVWHHYEGAPLRLHRLGLPEIRLDRSNPQGVVPAGVWQAAEPVGEFACGACFVGPGFDFADFVFLDADPEVRAALERIDPQLLRFG